MAHHCHAAGCEKNVMPEMLMCKRHWFMVPYAIRRTVWDTYRDGQCDDWQITHAYAVAAKAAVTAVATKEGITGEPLEKALRVYDMLDPERA
jgi:hypothetical protein